MQKIKHEILPNEWQRKVDVSSLSKKRAFAFGIFCMRNLVPISPIIETLQKYFNDESSIKLTDIIKIKYNIYEDRYSIRVASNIVSIFYQNMYYLYYTQKLCRELFIVNEKLAPYFSALLNLELPKTPYTDTLEIIVYLQDQLDYPILDGNWLNLWSPKYEYQINASVQKIAKMPDIANLIKACTKE